VEDGEFDPEPSFENFDFLGSIDEFFCVCFVQKFQAETARVVLVNFCDIEIRECSLDL
jgi:hypothetical protein